MFKQQRPIHYFTGLQSPFRRFHLQLTTDLQQSAAHEEDLVAVGCVAPQVALHSSGQPEPAHQFTTLTVILLLLLLLSSQLDLWGSPFGVRFLWMWPFVNSTTEVVTFGLHGWCTLGVYLLPPFTCLGHECQDLLSPSNGMHVCTD